MSKLFRPLAILSFSTALVFGCARSAFLPTVAAQAQAPAAGAAPTQKDLGAVQERLMELLRISPQLANVVSADPSLLANQDYVAHNNPELAQFLQSHPEIQRNPSFYLFSRLAGPGQRRYEVLEPKKGFEREYVDPRSGTERMLNELIPFLLALFAGGLSFAMIRMIVENRRWKRVWTVQNEVHSKLIEKFANSQELLGYMETDAGKRFLEATPIALQGERQRLPNLVARILGSLQLGVVLTLLGLCCLAMRNSVWDREAHAAMLVLGILTLAPGVGLLLSAGITWVIGKRLGLIQTHPSDRSAIDRIA